jgi:hypothetical protein
MQTAHLVAEPATIIYLLTGAAGLLFARFRSVKRENVSSTVMLFCRRSTREKLGSISLL